jgi:hypothetical protein
MFIDTTQTVLSSIIEYINNCKPEVHFFQTMVRCLKKVKTTNAKTNFNLIALSLDCSGQES